MIPDAEGSVREMLSVKGQGVREIISQLGAFGYTLLKLFDLLCE